MIPTTPRGPAVAPAPVASTAPAVHGDGGLEDRILRLFSRKDAVPLNAGEIAQRLGVAEPEAVGALLPVLESRGRLVRIKADRYFLPLEADLIPGRIRMNRQGKGFVQPDDPALRGQEIVVPESATGTALHEDRVLVRRDVRPAASRPGAGPAEITGTVIRILERRRTQIVGTLQASRQFLYVVPDDPRIPHDIYVPQPRDVGRPAQVGDKVVVELSEWTSRHTNPEGEVVEVLGPPDAEGVDMLAVLRQYQLPLRFSAPVLDEARSFGTTVRPEELDGRVDCRRNLIVTIDPDDAKDFDDAIGLERVGADQWRLWVHIADVSHYVRPGSALDAEASKRGNSTYLVDRVIPMLPEGLSNELCSLKPHVDRLTKCAEFLLANDGRVLRTKFYPAVIHSQRRFTYREAFAALQTPVTDAISQMLHEAHELAQQIRRRRFQNGSLNLDFPENKIRLDERGRVLRIERIENDASHQLIEEFMLLANEAVAARLMQLRRPALYRVHEEPAAPRLLDYRQSVLAQRIPCGNLSQRQEVQKLLHRLDGVPIGAALKVGFLRSLKRACYSVEPLGHYGLAKAEYTHFTSPIRRYADLVVHRALFETANPSRENATRALREVAEHLSVTERNSSDAERDSRDVKLFAYLRSQLDSGRPQRYSAVVVEVRNFGLFIDVSDLGMSGLVHLSSVEDDFYVFDAVRHQLVGRRKRRVFRLGDRLEVEVYKVDTFKRQVDFRLAAERLTEGRTARPGAEKSSASRGAPNVSRPSRPLTGVEPPHPSAGKRFAPPHARPAPGRQAPPRQGSTRPEPARQSPPRQQPPRHGPPRQELPRHGTPRQVPGRHEPSRQGSPRQAAPRQGSSAPAPSRSIPPRQAPVGPGTARQRPSATAPSRPTPPRQGPTSEGPPRLSAPRGGQTFRPERRERGRNSDR